MQEKTSKNLDLITLKDKNKNELLAIAKNLNIKGRSLLTKDKLIEEIKKKTVKNNQNKTLLETEQKISSSKEINYSSNIPQNNLPTQEIQENIELPHLYNKDMLTLMVRDPYWGFVYWEVSDSTIQKFNVAKEKLALRIYDITDLNFNGTNAHRFLHIDVGTALNWYVDFGEANRSFICELGYLDESGRFIKILSSNRIQTPSDKISNNIDERYMISDEDFEKIFQLSGGFIPSFSSKEFAEAGKRKLSLTMSSENVSSFSLSSFALSK